MSLDKLGKNRSDGSLNTRLTELLGIKYPIVQCGMVYVSTVSLAAAVCNAGGLGIMTSSEQSADELRRNIDKLRALIGDKPFGVNCTPSFPGYRESLEVVVKEKVPVLSHGLGNPFRVLGGKPDGLIFMPTVGSVKQAALMEKGGADALIVHGLEGGGHPGFISSMVLIPKVVDRVKIPVVASGGFCDGRGLVAALVLGAEGIGMGTRFATSKESALPLNIREWAIRSEEREPTISYKYDGMHMRSIKSDEMKGYRGWWSHPWDIIPALLALRRAYQLRYRDLLGVRRDLKKSGMPVMQLLASSRIGRRTMIEGIQKGAFLPCGQVIGRIDDIPSCQEIVERIVADAENTLRLIASRSLQLSGSPL